MTLVDPKSVFEGLPKLVLSLSVVHLSACVLFILGYGFGFGGNIISLFRPGDIFNIGLKDLAYVYVSSVFLPAIFKIIRISSENPYASDAVEKIEDNDNRSAALANLLKIQRWLMIIGYLSFVIMVGTAAFVIWKGEPFGYVMLSWPALFLVTLEQNTIKRIFKLDYRVFEGFDLVFILYISAIAFGAKAGAEDKDSTFIALNGKTIHCNQFLIIRPLSDYFIAINKEDQKVIVNGDCNVKFSLDKL